MANGGIVASECSEEEVQLCGIQKSTLTTLGEQRSWMAGLGYSRQEKCFDNAMKFIGSQCLSEIVRVWSQ